MNTHPVVDTFDVNNAIISILGIPLKYHIKAAEKRTQMNEAKGQN